MSKEQAKLFTEKLKSDTALQKKFQDAVRNAVLPLAREAGFDVKAEDFSNNELSPEELAQVVGGAETNKGKGGPTWLRNKPYVN